MMDLLKKCVLIGSLALFLPNLSSATTLQFSQFTETVDSMSNNPGRGFYLPLDTAKEILSKTKSSDFILKDGTEVNTIRYILDLSQYCNTQSITAKATELKSVLSHLDKFGKRVLFRAIYTQRNGSINSCGHYYPHSMAVIRSHLSQLSSVINEQPQAVAFIEAGFLGPWGEWHTSGPNGLINHQLLSEKLNRNEIVGELRKHIHSEIPILLRKPVFKLESYSWIKQTKSVGFHNDCFLSTKSNVQIDEYTFSSDYNAYTYDGYNNLEKLYGYVKQESLTVPMGGETCPNAQNRFSCSLAVPEIAELHYDYLNSVHPQQWVGKCYEEIKSRLGYRFHLLEIWSPKQVTTEGEITLGLNIKNTGFGKLMRSNRLDLGLIKNGKWFGIGAELGLTFEKDRLLKTIMPGKTQETVLTFKAPSEPGEYKLVLLLNDPSKWQGKYSIKLATQSANGQLLWDKISQAHQTGVVIKVVPSGSISDL